MNENRGPWYLLTGLVIGAALGLLYAWVVRPVQYTNTAPSSLRAEYKDQYRAIIAAAYLANGDLLRARARLELLQDSDLYRVLAEQAQRTLADGGSPQEARGLGLLAVAVGQSAPTTPGGASPEGTAASSSAEAPLVGTSASGTQPTGELTGTQPGYITATLASGTAGSPILQTPVLETPDITPVMTDLGQATASPSGTLVATPTARSAGTTSPGATRTPTPTRTPGPTSTPLPTRTATPTQGAPFVLDRQELVCDPDLVQPLDLALVQVQVYDSAGKPVPGVESVINWDGGENHFYTGLKPEINPGYADFAMQPGVIYSLRLAEGGQIIPGLTPAECERTGGVRYWGAWRLVFVQP
jgi:hypothetical protein